MISYKDHIGLWDDELREWLPEVLFDAHVHIGPPEAAGSVSSERSRSALCTYLSFTLDELIEAAATLYSGKTMAGWIAFPFPQREIDLSLANDYLIAALQREPRLHGFLLADPRDATPAILAYERALRQGVRFVGVKPYADRLGKSNFDATMEEFLPDALLEFMNEHGLIMMLHTSGFGVGDADVQDYLRRAARLYPRVRIILAHLGRYVRPEQFLSFLDSGILQECPSLYLEMSSATRSDLYRRVLLEGELWRRLLFGSDVPFGLITGVEQWSAERGAIFLARDTYSWSDPAMEAALAAERGRLTYNTYHVVKAFKDALADLALSAAEETRIVTHVFARNALELLGG